MKTKIENVNNVKRCQRRKKLFAIDAFGGKCQICGYNKCIDALEFHHIYKSTKEAKPSYVIMRWSWEKAKKELDKCILLCANCHRETHFKQIDFSIIKNLVNPWLDKSCEFCDKKFSTKNDSQKFCSMVCNSLNQRKVDRPSKEFLESLIKDAIPWTKMGKMFGVSDNAVRKWAKNYNLLGSKL